MSYKQLSSHLFSSPFALLIVALLCGGAKADLVGHWEFESDYLDSSGFGNDGSPSGSPTFTGDTPPLGGGFDSLNLSSATNDVVTVADSTSLDVNGALTIAAWVNLSGTTHDNVVAKGPSAGSLSSQPGNYDTRIDNSTRRQRFYMELSTSTPNTFESFASLAGVPSGWHHVAITAVPGGEMTFYLDGNYNGSSALKYALTTNNSPLLIGNRADSGTDYDGSLDDVRVYNHALTGAEIAALAGNASPVLRYADVLFPSVRASSEFDSNRPAVDAVNGVGLTASSHSDSRFDGWLSESGDTTGFFDVDLGGIQTINKLRFWNSNDSLNGDTDRGVQTADVYIAGADGVFGATPVLSGVNLAQAPGTPGDFSQEIDLGGVGGRFVRIDILSNWGDPDFTGISEISVDASPIAGKAPLPVAIDSFSSRHNTSRGANTLIGRQGLLFGDASHSENVNDMWVTAANGLADAEVTFDLGEIVELGYMRIWNYNEAGQLGRGVKTMDVFVSDDGETFTLFGEVELAISPGGSTIDFSEIVTLGGVATRFVKFDVTSIHGGVDARAGLSEVQFFAVPEPASGWLLASGIVAAASLAGRRRRRAR